MRATTYVFVNEPDRDDEVRELIAAAGLTIPETEDTFHQLAMAADSKDLVRLREQLEAKAIAFFERRDHVYTEDELREYPLLSLLITSPEAGMGGPTHGTKFDLADACPDCGTGARQEGALTLRESDLPTKVALFQTMDGEVLASRTLKGALENAGLSGLELRQAVRAGDGAALEWFQLIPVHELPPWDSASVGYQREQPCPSCMRDGYFDDGKVPFELLYGREALVASTDISWTYERFGNSSLSEDFSASHFAAPRPLVSPRFLDLVRSERVDNCAFLPVREAP